CVRDDLRHLRGSLRGTGAVLERATRLAERDRFFSPRRTPGGAPLPGAHDVPERIGADLARRPRSDRGHYRRRSPGGSPDQLPGGRSGHAFLPGPESRQGRERAMMRMPARFAWSPAVRAACMVAMTLAIAGCGSSDLHDRYTAERMLWRAKREAQRLNL